MNRSPEQAKLAPALVKALGELSNPKPTRNVTVKTTKGYSYTYSYVELHALIDMVRPVFAKHKLAIMQDTSGVTTFVHESGEWVSSDPFTLMPTEQTPQGFGGAVSYARRYSLAAMCGLAADSDDDAGYASSKGGQASSGGQHQERSTEPPVDAQPKGGGHVPKGLRFAMDDFPHYKSGTHVFAQGPDTRWNGWTWEEMARSHEGIIAAGSSLGDSPLESMFHNAEYIKSWNREQTETLRKAAIQRGERKREEPTDESPCPCPQCGKTFEDGCNCVPF